MEIFSFFSGYDIGLPVISALLSTNDTNGFSVNESLDNRLSIWKPGLMLLFLRLIYILGLSSGSDELFISLMIFIHLSLPL